MQQRRRRTRTRTTRLVPTQIFHLAFSISGDANVLSNKRVSCKRNHTLLSKKWAGKVDPAQWRGINFSHSFLDSRVYAKCDATNFCVRQPGVGCENKGVSKFVDSDKGHEAKNLYRVDGVDTQEIERY